MTDDPNSPAAVNARVKQIIREYKKNGVKINDIAKKADIHRNVISMNARLNYMPSDKLVDYFVREGYSEAWIKLGILPKKSAGDSKKENYLDVKELKGDIEKLRLELSRVSARLEGTIKELDDLKRIRETL